MHDPCFEAALAEIRGFDLGDDAELLGQLEARSPRDLSEDELLLWGVLLHRAGRLDEALACFVQAGERGAGRSRALYLESCVLRDLGRPREAIDALGEAREAAATDALMSAVDLLHAQGLLAWSAGDHAAALAAIEGALAQEEGSAARWLHRGQLLVALGRLDEADLAFARALVEEPDLDLAMAERAALEASRGHAEGAAKWLAMASRLDPAHGRRAAEDPRFDALRGHPALGEWLEPARSPAELAWLDGLAPWMPALRRDSELESLGLQWLGEGQSEQILRELLAAHERGPLGTMHTEATLRRSRELLATRRAVARGPGSRTREGVEQPCFLFVDALRPQDGLWLALSESYPPFLWIRVEPRPGGVRRALGESFPPPRLTHVDMVGRARGFLGYRSRLFVPSPYGGGLEPAGIMELDRHFSINPFVESAAWGSAYDDDPWPDEIPDQPDLVLKLAERQAVVTQQARGRVWSSTRRTRHSRSYLTLEIHHRDLFVAEVRYRPSAHAGVVEAMNAYFGCDYPADMPVDAVAALLGFQFEGAGDLEAEVLHAEDPEELAGLIHVLSALRHDDLGVLHLYRSLLEHPASIVRSTIGEIAVAYNYEALLEEMSLREPDAELRAEIEALLDQGIPLAEYDPWADAGEDEPVEIGEADLVEEAEDALELDDHDLLVDSEPERQGGGRR